MSGTMDRKFVTVLMVATTLVLPPITNQTPLPGDIFSHNETTRINNKTMAELVQHQTDTIKKIVSNHYPNHHPVYQRYPLSDEKNRQPSLEELKLRCQHLMKLMNTSSSTSTTTSSSTTTTSTTPSPKLSLRPLTGFYVTTEPTTTTTTTTTTVTKTPKENPTPVTIKSSPSVIPQQNVKLIKLEPVILQKTILSDGRVVYYWHRSLPSAVQVAPVTTPSTTTTSGYSFRNYLPSFYPFGSSESSSTTEEKPASAPGVLYKQQLKFIVPVPYVPPNHPDFRRPFEADQFSYYPKPPEAVQLELPYVQPTFQVIKAVAVPNQDVALATE